MNEIKVRLTKQMLHDFLQLSPEVTVERFCTDPEYLYIVVSGAEFECDWPENLDVPPGRMTLERAHGYGWVKLVKA